MHYVAILTIYIKELTILVNYCQDNIEPLPKVVVNIRSVHFFTIKAQEIDIQTQNRFSDKIGMWILKRTCEPLLRVESGALEG